MKNKPTVYLETSVISYLAGRLSKNIITLTRQQITRTWWEDELEKFDLYVSDFVIYEVSKGDTELSKKRMHLIQDVSLLPSSEEVEKLAYEYIIFLGLPSKSFIDALHLAIASWNKIDYLLTWNLTHIANKIFVRKYEVKNRELGLTTPIVCTPEELLTYGIGENYYE